MKFSPITQVDAVIEAFKALGGDCSISEIENWVTWKFGARWKDFGTCMADMVPEELDGNRTSSVPLRKRVLRRVDRGVYTLIE